MICLDPLREIKDEANPKSKHTLKGCYLFVDNGDLWSLHTFAKMLNISKDTFKSDCFLPRYILNEQQRKLAAHKGAKQVPFKKTVKTVRINKEKTASEIQQKRRLKEKMNSEK